MNYSQSSDIREIIESHNNFLLNCHASPDADSVGSALSMYLILLDLGKSARIICPDILDKKFSFLDDFEVIEQNVDFEKFDFSNSEVFFSLDSGSWNRITGKHDLLLPQIPIVVIDHHKTNQKYGAINLIDAQRAANCELLYLIYKDWGIDISKKVATALLAGIIGDTGVFRFQEATSDTFGIAMSLMQKGADKNEIVHALYNSIEESVMRYWIEVLSFFKVNYELKYAMVAVPLSVYKKYSPPKGVKGELADMFLQSIANTNFGFFAQEEEEGLVTVSFRSRTGYDVSRLASKLGGGGHLWASAARIKSLSLDEAILEIEKCIQE